MNRLSAKIVSCSILLFMAAPICWAGLYDLNPGMEAVKYKHEMTDDVAGQGYVMEYKRVNTNNLSLFEYSHGSGKIDQADILNSEQKTTHDNTYYIYNFLEKGGYDFRKKAGGANSVISYTRQYDNIQSPTSFAWGTGYYAANPISFNSLLKDKTEAKSYQESASMHRQIEYARAVTGDIAVDMNCTGATSTTDGKGTLSMKVDDEVTQGTLHVGELLTSPMKDLKTPKVKNKQGWGDAIIEVDNDYIGDFHVQKTMKLEITKSKPIWAEDWLPCCSGGFFDLPAYNFDKQYGGLKGVFDCTCRNSSISSMKPKWNTSMAQFPNDRYRNQP